MTARAAPVYQWQPSTAEIARRAGMAVDDVIRFDHNTSPRRPPWTDEVVADASRLLNEYPAADYTPLRSAAATYAGVAPDQVVPGAGADELILLIAKAFLHENGVAVTDTPSYPMYRIASLQREARLVEIPRSPDLAVVVDDLVGAAADAAVTWLCVPHNPIGDRLDDAAIEAVLEAGDGLVVLDAAYAQFAGDRWGGWVQRHDRLIVLHTLSKAAGLAGVRVGYSLSSPEVAAALHAVRPPGSIGTLSAALAVRALQDSWIEENVAAILADRSHLADGLAELGLEPLPTATNFVLTRVGQAAREVMEGLMGRGIVVRAFPSDGPLAAHLRFTVRTPAEHDRLFEALSKELP